MKMVKTQPVNSHKFILIMEHCEDTNPRVWSEIITNASRFEESGSGMTSSEIMEWPPIKIYCHVSLQTGKYIHSKKIIDC